MATWSEGDLALGGINVHYYRTGTIGAPPVVLLHGFGDNGRSWTRLAEVLAPTYDVIALDCCGHGLSGGPEHGFRERAASDVLGAIDALGPDRPVILGHSMGAATVGEVACQAYVHGEQVSRSARSRPARLRRPWSPAHGRT